VAVKMLDMEGVDQVTKWALRQEALIMCQLYHPSIGRVYGKATASATLLPTLAV
jgi:hypothetical protein